MIQLSDIQDRMPELDLRRHVAEIAGAAHLQRRAQPRRWPLAVFALVAGTMAAWTIFRNDAARRRAHAALTELRARTSRMVMGEPSVRDMGEEAVAAPTAGTAEIRPSSFDIAWDRTADDPAALGAASPAIDEPVSPAGAGARS